MNKYKIEYKQTETFIIDVLAKDEKEALKLAFDKWQKEDYQETGNIDITVGNILTL